MIGLTIPEEPLWTSSDDGVPKKRILLGEQDFTRIVYPQAHFMKMEKKLLNGPVMGT
jgi:hypothetical protein